MKFYKIVYLFIILIFSIFIIIYNYFYEKKYIIDHFTNETNDNLNNSEVINLIDINDIYDNFYCNTYEVMISHYKNLLVQYEINNLFIHTKIDSTSLLVDLGCGTGDHILELAKKKIDIIAIDQSEYMLNISNNKFLQEKEKYQSKDKMGKIKFIQGNFSNRSLLKNESVTHITMYYFSFYFSDNKQELINNIYFWLKKDGYFIVHLVNPQRFDPLIDAAANPLFGISLHKLSKDQNNRKQVSKVKFDTFSYESIFSYDSVNETGTYYEKFMFSNNKKRYQIQKLNMPIISKIIKLITDSKLKLNYIDDLSKRGYEYQYILYFQKE